MKTTMTIHLRRFPVLVRDNRTGEKLETTITLEKSQLQAAQLVGQSSKELICRLCNKAGYTSWTLAKPGKLRFPLTWRGFSVRGNLIDLSGLSRRHPRWPL